MSTAPPPSRPLPPPKPSTGTKSLGSTQATNPIGKRSFAVSTGRNVTGQKTVIYGPGGVGKSELAANMQSIGVKPLFLDIGSSTKFLDVARIDDIANWDELRAALQNTELLSGYDAVVIDDLSVAQEWSGEWTCANVKDEKGNWHQELSKYPFGKGYEYNYDTFLKFLGDCDSIARRGIHVICIAHDCVVEAPNPHGEDYIRYAPRLQEPGKKGIGSIRARVKEWCDHLLFIGYDVAIGEDGKGKGGGTRAIYGTELPTHLAKTRKHFEPIVYEKGSAEVWTHLFKGENNGNG
jgi:hypothetical protein